MKKFFTECKEWFNSTFTKQNFKQKRQLAMHAYNRWFTRWFW